MTEYEIPTIQEGFDEIKEQREYETHDEYTIVIEDEVLISLEEFYMNFDIGRKIALVRVETPEIQVKIKATKITVAGKVISFTGLDQDESFQIFC